MSETLTTRVSLYGRFADDLTRAPVSGSQYVATLSPGHLQALRKTDGHFVFIDVPPSATAYELTVAALSYRSRTLSVSLPTTTPVELAGTGEDELFVLTTGITATSQRVDFPTLPFIPAIRAGAPVFGPAGFTATLQEPLEGSGVSFATLSTTTGLAPQALLRIVRSSNLILSPGPNYRFEAPVSLVAVKAVENSAGDPPLAETSLEIDQVNGTPLTTTAIGGVPLHTVVLPGPSTLLLGAGRSVRTTSSSRGDALFYFPPDLPITALRLRVTRTGYQPLTQSVAVTPGQRTSATLRLNRS